jgi:hypothetical protein
MHFPSPYFIEKNNKLVNFLFNLKPIFFEYLSCFARNRFRSRTRNDRWFKFIAQSTSVWIIFENAVNSPCCSADGRNNVRNRYVPYRSPSIHYDRIALMQIVGPARTIHDAVSTFRQPEVGSERLFSYDQCRSVLAASDSVYEKRHYDILQKKI